MNSADPLSLSFWAGIGVSLVCGGIIGFERQLRGKPAGIRTCILICLGTHAFVQIGRTLEGLQVDPTRIIAQVVTGVGFLGAGVILAREGLVTGVTTAAVIWVLAAIGAVVGLGHYAMAIALTVVTVAVLSGVEVLEASFRRLRRGVHAPRFKRKAEEE